MDEREVVAIEFPPAQSREQHRIEKGNSTATGLTPVSMLDKGPSVLVTFVVNESGAKTYGRYSEGDKMQRQYMKGQLQSIEKLKTSDKGEE